VERVFQQGQLKYGGGVEAVSKRRAAAAAHPSTDELRDTY
jgi:heptaprenylglyceryl phosphate synthase